MRYLYIDNIRGFADTYIPIKNVNFLVGENSTGKTTFLEILRLLSSPGFWIAQDFYIDGARLNHFQNIVSIGSPDRSYFRIGVIEYSDTEISKKQNGNVNVFLMTFKDKDGKPEISKYNCIIDNNEIELIFSRRTIFHKSNPVDRDSEIIEIFGGWVSQGTKNDKNYKGYRRTTVPVRQVLRNYPISYILNLLEGKLLGGKESKDEQTRGIRLTEIFIPTPDFAEDFAWLAPIRSEPKRTYDAYKITFTPEGDHVPYLLRQILSSRKKYPKSRDISLYMERFGKESGLYDSIAIKEFGRSPTSPFEVDITMGGKSLSIRDVGYGVSQSLPVIVELLARPKGTWYAIQQPEIHLHPKAQAVLGELIYAMAANEEKGFCIETHSDYIIDRFRLMYGKDMGKNINLDAQVLYFERTKTGNCICPIKIERDGKYSEDQPATFREFFIKEGLSLLEI